MTHFKNVLKTHFEESVYSNLPFKIYVKETFLKYCDPLAKHAFLIDLEEQKFEFKDIPNTETPFDVGKMVVQETNILKNNRLKDVLKHFDCYVRKKTYNPLLSILKIYQNYPCIG